MSSDPWEVRSQSPSPAIVVANDSNDIDFSDPWEAELVDRLKSLDSDLDESAAPAADGLAVAVARPDVPLPIVLHSSSSPGTSESIRASRGFGFCRVARGRPRGLPGNGKQRQALKLDASSKLGPQRNLAHVGLWCVYFVL